MNCPPEVRAILLSLDDPEKLLAAVLEHAVIQMHAIRGLVFDQQKVIGAIGYDHLHDRNTAWQALAPLLTECYGVVVSRESHFTGALRDRDTWFSPGGAWLGAAAVLTGRQGNLAVVGIERESPLTEEELTDFEEWLQLASKPAAISLSNERLGRMQRREPLKLRDLPLNELEELPRLQEIQM